MTSVLDSAIADSVYAPAGPVSAPTPLGLPAQAYRIVRAGARPLHFHGSELAMAMSYTPALPYWYEVNLYRTTAQRFVVAIRQFFQSEDEQDVCHAWECETLPEALDRLETYDAAQDVRLGALPGDGASPADLHAMALDLRAQSIAARRHYGSLIGRFFYDLEKDQ